MALTSCEKQDCLKYEGSYSYKTIGKVQVTSNEMQKLGQAALDSLAKYGITPDTSWVSVAPEQGQMHVLVKDSDRNEVVLTFNAILGDVSTVSATADDRQVTFDGVNVKSARLTDGTFVFGNGEVAVTGSGAKLDDVIIFDMNYTGSIKLLEIEFEILDSRIQCVAKEN